MHENRTFTVCPLDASHLAGAAELERLCFSEPWSERALALLLGESAYGVACVQNGRVIAYGGMMTALDEGQVTNIAVHPDARRQGVGRALLSEMLREAQRRGLTQISLEVRASNAAAIGLYESFGFAVAGRRRHFYRDPAEDALVMLLGL